MRTATGGSARLLGRLEGVLPAESFGPASGDGIPEVAPADAAEAAEVVRLAVEEGVSVLPRGAGLGPAVPWPPARPELIALSTRRMGGIRDHAPADLTLRVGAGAALEEVERALDHAGQWLPLDPPGGGRVTVGGAVAEGTAGPLQAGFGRIRDHLLGLELVTGEGEVLLLGGRVVKNVAGFDLVRLAAGSRGALGVVTEATVRLFPRPDVDRTLVWERSSPAAGIALGRRIAEAGLPAAALEWGSDEEDRSGKGGDTVLRLLDSAPAAASLARRAGELAGAPDRVLDAEASRAFWTARAEGEGGGRLALRVDGPPAAGSALVEALTPISAAVGARQWLHLLDGGLRLSVPGPDLPEPAVLSRVGARAAAAGGRLRLLRVPDGWPDDGGAEARGGRAGPASFSVEARLRGRLVEAFDPHGCFPGSWREGWR